MLLPALLLVPLLFTSGAVAAALPTEGAAALMVDPQVVQNLAPFETGLPHCGQTFSVCVPGFARFFLFLLLPYFPLYCKAPPVFPLPKGLLFQLEKEAYLKAGLPSRAGESHRFSIIRNYP